MKTAHLEEVLEGFENDIKRVIEADPTDDLTALSVFRYWLSHPDWDQLYNRTVSEETADLLGLEGYCICIDALYNLVWFAAKRHFGVED